MKLTLFSPLYSLYQKTEEEKKIIRIAREKAKKEKEKRRKEQELNVKKKEKAKVDHKNKSLAGMQKKLQGNDDLMSMFVSSSHFNFLCCDFQIPHQ